MCPLGYCTMLRQSKEPTYLRVEMVRYAREHDVKPCARRFSTTVKTVHKWLRRWEPGSLPGSKTEAARRTTRARASHPSLTPIIKV